MRTDRKTGEPILSPRLSADQLHAMANDPGWRPWMRLIAEHPNAWPGLVDWWRTAQEQGFDTAGAAPEPPESMRGRRRVAIPAAPLPPENGAEPEAADPVGSTDGWESVPLASKEGLAADPAPSPPEPEEDAGRQSPDPDRREEPEPETMREALDDADDDFAALEQVADTEPSTMDIPPLPEPAETEPPMDDGTDTDPFADVRVRRAIPWKAIGITVAALLAVGLMAGGGVMLARHHGEETARRTLAQATADCRQAHDTAGRQRDALEQAVEKARRLTSATGKDQVTDQSTLDALDKLAGKAIPKLPSCPASDPDTGRVSTAGKEYKRRTQALRDAMDKVNRSILDKTVKDAKKLHDESAGKVADESHPHGPRQGDGKPRRGRHPQSHGQGEPVHQGQAGRRQSQGRRGPGTGRAAAGAAIPAVRAVHGWPDHAPQRRLHVWRHHRPDLRGNHRKNHHARAIGPIDAIHTDPAACAVDPVEAIRHRRRDRRLRTKE